MREWMRGREYCNVVQLSTGYLNNGAGNTHTVDLKGTSMLMLYAGSTRVCVLAVVPYDIICEIFSYALSQQTSK